MLIPALLIFLASVVLTGLIRRYALSQQVLDIPNQRSSHTTPTARGGGLAIVLSFLGALIWLTITHDLPGTWVAGLGAPFLVAVIGFCDDHTHVPARWRFLTHVAAALLALYCLNAIPAGVSGLNPFAQLSWAGVALLILLLVWLLNLFNFMDGIDGIASSEALFVAWGLAGFLCSVDLNLCLAAVALGLAAAGFLVWNWPPAKIFMGDVGSGFLGLLLGILILMAARQTPVLLFCGVILFGIFAVDASYTLLVRIATGQVWYAAHCSHAYQRAARQYGHLRVLMACWLINLCWLLPIAVLVFLQPVYAWLGLLISYAPLLALAYFFKAGQIPHNSL